MFFGENIKTGQSIELNKHEGSVLTLSTVCLKESQDNAKYYLQLHQKGNDFNLCCLSKNT